ncbi:MAG: hypothetical protein ACOC0M_02720 [Halomonas sp.]
MEQVTKPQWAILAAVFEEQRQTRRGVTLEMVGIATNARTVVQHEQRQADVLALMASGHLVRADGGTVGITAKGKVAIEQAPPEATQPEPDPQAQEAARKPGTRPPRKPGPRLGEWPTQAAKRAREEKRAGEEKRAREEVYDETAKRSREREAYNEVPKINTQPQEHLETPAGCRVTVTTTLEERPDNSEPGTQVDGQGLSPAQEATPTELTHPLDLPTTLHRFAAWGGMRIAEIRQDEPLSFASLDEILELRTLVGSAIHHARETSR